MTKLVIVGQYEIHPADSEAVAELMRIMMTETMKEQGCQHYAFSRDLTDPNRFQLSELWQDDAALAAHFESAHMATFRAGMSKCRVQQRSVKRYDVADIKEL